MLKIGLIGSGNVAIHLARAFSQPGNAVLAGIYARTPDFPEAASLPLVYSAEALSACDLIVIAVSDDAIAQVSQALPFDGKLVAHTSGSRPLSDIAPHNRSASFYPLQTFSRNRKLDYSQIPVLLEAFADEDYSTLESAASSLGPATRIGFEQRRAVHLSAVFACNFVNHMYAIAHRLCRENSVPFDTLRPLIAETAAKVMELSPDAAQTGPAVRNDQKTISAHLELLRDERLQALYRDITQSIQYDPKKL